jgi:hypothetical protein
MNQRIWQVGSWASFCITIGGKGEFCWDKAREMTWMLVWSHFPWPAYCPCHQPGSMVCLSSLWVFMINSLQEHKTTSFFILQNYSCCDYSNIVFFFFWLWIIDTLPEKSLALPLSVPFWPGVWQMVFNYPFCWAKLSVMKTSCRGLPINQRWYLVMGSRW